MLPLAVATVVTVTASLYKIWPWSWLWATRAQHNAFKQALADGKESFGSAKSVEAMEAVVRNTFVQGTLSIVFLVLSVIVIIAAIIATIRAFPHGGPDTEDPALPSRI